MYITHVSAIFYRKLEVEFACTCNKLTYVPMLFSSTYMDGFYQKGI